MLLRYTLKHPQETPCIQPTLTQDTTDTGSQQGDQRSPVLFQGVSTVYPVMYMGLYLLYIMGVLNVSGVYPMYSVYIKPQKINT